ncbi:MAG TPA: transposase [Salinisphaeraceae bacterium]|nr:transposase [Salinisphaeraceae bacterium]
MAHYRRYRHAGGCYFFTVVLANRRNRLLTDNIKGLRRAFHEVKQAHPFTIEAIVVLPDHLHCIWTLPANDSDFSTRWRQIKSAFSRQVPKVERRSASRMKKGERGIWQRRFWEHAIRDDLDYRRHVDYIHYNPVKHGHVRRVGDWPYSSFHRFVRMGIYPDDWGDSGVGEVAGVGKE